MGATKHHMDGMQFGRWKAIERDRNRKHTGGDYWICQCECGVVRSRKGQTLRTGTSKGCASCAGRDKANLVYVQKPSAAGSPPSHGECKSDRKLETS